MTERVKSAESFDAFFGKEDVKNEISTTSPAIAALIKSQPVLHHRRQTPSDRDGTLDSERLPLTTNVANSVVSSPTKPTGIESVQSKAYDSDFENDPPESTRLDRSKKSSSLPPKKQSPVEPSPRRAVSKVKASHTITSKTTTSNGTAVAAARRKERFLPYIRPSRRSKVLPTRTRPKPTKNEVELRLLSARRSKFNELQSRLADLRRQLEAEQEENRVLRIIQKREEKTLKVYEDQEYDVHKVARDYTREIGYVKEEINEERDTKTKLQKEVETRDEELRQKTKRIKRYEKLVNDEELDEPDELRDRLKASTKQLKQYEEKIATKEKYIGSLEKDYRNEIQDELLKQRDLKRELEKQSKSYKDLLLKFEEKNRQVSTMHIYIQRGGRRPSATSVNLSKSRSLQSLQDTSPRYREKILEYDKKRREQEKYERQNKPKPRPKPLPAIVQNPTPPKVERRKYVPDIEQHPKMISTKPSFEPEKHAPVDRGHLFSREKATLHRLVTPNSIEEEKSNLEDDMTYQSTIAKSPSPTILRTERHIVQARIHKRLSSPSLSPIDSKFLTYVPEQRSITPHLSNKLQPLPSSISKPPAKRELDDKWMDFFDTDKKEESTKDDLLSKLISHEPKEKKIVPVAASPSSSSSPSPPPPTKPVTQHPAMIMFEPSSITTNGQPKKVPPRRPSLTNYDFEQAVINLHEGKPVATQPNSKTSVDPFDSLFSNNTSQPAARIPDRDDTFTVPDTKIEPFDSIFGPPSSTTASVLPIGKTSTTRTFPSQNDKLQRPKIVTNTSKTVPNRTYVEEIEEFVL